MAIRFMEDGRKEPWHVYYNHPYTGKRKTEKFADEGEAKKRNAQLKYQLKYERETFLPTDHSQADDSGELTVDDVLLMYLRDVAARKKGLDFAEKNMATTLSHLRFVRPVIGHLPVARLTRSHMREVVQELRRDKTITQQYKEKTIKRKIKGNGQSTINRKISIIQSALNWAEEAEVIEENPILRFRAPRGPNNKPSSLTPEEVERILLAASDHVRRVVIIGVGTGARIGPSELFKLTWDDVALERNSIRIWSADKNRSLPSRDLDLKPNVAVALRVWRDNDAAKGHHGHIIHWQQKPISSIKTAWWRTLERANIDRKKRRLRPYDCRHFFITQALANGADLKALSTLVGHADPTMILRHYQDVVEKTKRQAINSVADIDLPDLSTGPMDLTKPTTIKDRATT